VSPTVLGVVLVALCLRYAGDAARLVQIGLVAAVFEAAAAFVIGGFGLQPGLVPALAVIALVAGQYMTGRRSVAEGPGLHLMTPLLVLVAYAVVSAVLLPEAFAGRIIVWPQKFVGPAPEPLPLAPGQGNTNQVLYLMVNVALAGAVALALGRAGTPWRALVRAYLLGAYVVVGLVIWDFASRTIGLPFPTAMLHSNPGWAIVAQSLNGLPRLQGPFAEPSALAFYLVGVAFACTALCLRGHAIMRADLLLLMVIAATFFSTSTTGIAALAIGLPAMLGIAAMRGENPRLHRLVRMLALPGGIVLLAGAGLLVLKPGLVDMLVEVVDVTLNKTQSESFEERSAMNQDAWNAFLASGGLGVGWGSTRASSMLPGLMAGGGVVGAVAVLWFAVRLGRAARAARARAPDRHAACIALDAFGAALAGQLLAAALSAPMITTPIFFAQVGIVAAATIRLGIEAAARSREPYLGEPGALSAR
jgi:hypothetical protein